MALTFGANSSDKVDCGSGANMDDHTAFTMIIIGKISSFGAGGRFISKGDDIKELRRGSASNRLRLFVGRATTDANADSSGGELNMDQWGLIAGTYDESDGPRIFVGNYEDATPADRVVAEVGYTSREVGVDGTTADAANNLFIGQRVGTENRAPGGDIAVGMYISKRLVLADLISLQYHLRNLVETEGYWILGFDGTSSVPDYSGNGNNGTPTGLVLADHAPLPPPFGFDIGWQGRVAPAAPGGGYPSEYYDAWRPMMNPGAM